MISSSQYELNDIHTINNDIRDQAPENRCK